MGNPRARYTLEFKMEAMRMVRNGRSQSATAKILGIIAQPLNTWIKASDAGKLNGAGKHWASYLRPINYARLLQRLIEPASPKGSFLTRSIKCRD